MSRVLECYCPFSISCHAADCSYQHNWKYSISDRKRISDAIPPGLSHPLVISPKDTSYCPFGDACFHVGCQKTHVNPPDTRREIRKFIKHIISDIENENKAKEGSKPSLTKFQLAGIAMKKRDKDPSSLTDKERELCEFGDKQQRKKLEKLSAKDKAPNSLTGVERHIRQAKYFASVKQAMKKRDENPSSLTAEELEMCKYGDSHATMLANRPLFEPTTGDWADMFGDE